MKTDIQQQAKPKSQSEEVLYHLKYIGTLTSIKAIKEYGITRLASTIHNLKKDGWDIRTQKHKFNTRHGKSSYYSEYYLVREITLLDDGSFTPCSVNQDITQFNGPGYTIPSSVLNNE